MWREEGPLWIEKSKCKAWTGRALDWQGHTLNRGTTTAFVGSYTNCPELATPTYISSSQEPSCPGQSPLQGASTALTSAGRLRSGSCPLNSEAQLRPAPLRLLSPELRGTAALLGASCAQHCAREEMGELRGPAAYALPAHRSQLPLLLLECPREP